MDTLHIIKELAATQFGGEGGIAELARRRFG
jgi:hypothetical protein